MGGGVGGSLKVGSNLSSGVLGPLSAPSTCGIPPGVAGVTRDLLLLGVLLPEESSNLRFLFALVSRSETCCCCSPCCCCC